MTERGAGVSGLCSMATRGLLAELAAAWDGRAVIEATGGVDAARRVRAGEVMDVVVLADSVMRALETDGVLVPGSLAEIAVSSIALAVRVGETSPDLSTPEAVKRAVLAAGRTGYSTGPSGDHLMRLLADWGVRDALDGRLVQAPPGVPVGRLLLEGTVDLAVQQLSELMGLPGIVIAGPLPPPIRSDTVFTAGVSRTAPRPDAARGFVAFLASPAAADAKRRHGLASVSSSAPA